MIRLYPQPSPAFRRALVLSLALLPLAASVQAQSPSTVQNPTVTFSSVGAHQVTLKACNSNGVCDTTTKTVMVFSFADVPPTYWAWHFIEGLQAAGVPTTCGSNPPRFCPDSPMTRGDMAIFLLRSKEGKNYTPPSCTTAVFDDVPCSDPQAPWINELVQRGVTAGCGGRNYCPDNPVTRDQMAVFLLATAGYAPDNTTCLLAPFLDVPCSTPFEPFIKELVTLG